MADRMTKEQEQATLAAAENGDVFAMYELGHDYYYGNRLLGKNKYKEKGAAWLLKSAEGGYLKATERLSHVLDKKWGPVYMRALDLLLRKYKAIYCDADRKEEARTILALLLKLTSSEYDNVWIDGKCINLHTRYRDAIAGVPEYEVDYDMTDAGHENRYKVSAKRDDVQKHLEKSNILKYALVKPDQLDDLEKEVEALESTLLERIRKRREEERSPLQELFRFTTDFADAVNYDCYIPAKYVEKVVEDFRFLPLVPAFHKCPYVECSVVYDRFGSKDFKNPKPMPLLDLGSYLEDSEWGTYYHRELHINRLIIVNYVDKEYKIEKQVAIPAGSAYGNVRFENSAEVITVSSEDEKATLFMPVGGRPGKLIHPEVLIEKLKLRDTSLELHTAHNSYYQTRYDALFDLARNGYDDLDKGVVALSRLYYNTYNHRIEIEGRVAKGSVHPGDAFSLYDIAEKKQTSAFKIEKVVVDGGNVEEATFGDPVVLVTSIEKSRPAPWDWNVSDLHDLLVRVK